MIVVWTGWLRSPTSSSPTKDYRDHLLEVIPVENLPEMYGGTSKLAGFKVMTYERGGVMTSGAYELSLIHISEPTRPY